MSQQGIVGDLQARPLPEAVPRRFTAAPPATKLTVPVSPALATRSRAHRM